MAGVLVGGAFLSGFINVVFDRLISPDALNLIRGKKLDQCLVDRLKTALLAAAALLNDAEKKQFHDSNIKNWLDTLKDAVYVADDLLDHVLTKAATQHKKVTTNFLSRLLPYYKDREMVVKMEEIVSRIEYLEKRKYFLGLNSIPNENLSQRIPSTSLIKGEVYGREKDQEALIKLLLDENTEAKISVIPIVGMGGIGKTTLAQWLYNNKDLKEFDLKVWVCVSEEFDIVKITQTIIQAITKTPCDMKDLNLLQLDLKDKLIGKKFFIVLDDVWSDDYDRWNRFETPFQYGLKGSKILVTTRSQRVASVVQTCPPYSLKELSRDHCWSVFADHACFPQSNGDPTLEQIGKEIVEKCKGLPLAAQTLGGLLRVKHDVEEWNTILTSDIWEFSFTESKIVPALLISYYHLPPYLKRCFAYCSLFPKDYEFDIDELILLWMAEDLLERPKRGKTLEEVGYEYFDDLASRLFFNKFSGDSNFFVMHDIMHDLAKFVAGEFYFRSEELGNEDMMSEMTRHLSYERLSYPIAKTIDAIGGLKSLRTLMPIDFFTFSLNIESTISDVLSKCKCLRVLSFAGYYDLDVLPDSIGELIHLRYLNLSRTRIKTLPKSLGDLYNLQTLKLSGCHELTMLPNSIQNLVHMRHLDISETSLKEMPRGMSKLINLQLLSYFVVGKHAKNGVKELGALSNLHGSLRIEKLENVSDGREALEERIIDKTHIEDLHLEWSEEGVMISSIQSERDILDKLQPHKDLQRLTIKRYRGTIFPDWVGHFSYQNMTSLYLDSCRNCMLPSLGQLPSLKQLKIEIFWNLENIGVEFYKNDDDHTSLAAPFPSLESLTFSVMLGWEVWHPCESNAFPQLKHLQMRNCPKFRGDLPNHLPALETLKIDNCDKLVSSLPKAPVLRDLRITRSEKVGLQEIPLSLQYLSIEGYEVKSAFQSMTINEPTCLQSLDISNCKSSISFPGDRIPVSLKTLTIRDCRKLEFPRKQQHHELLQSLEIENSCDSLTSFPLEIFPNLNSLYFNRCENMESLSVPQSWDAALRHLKICKSSISFSGDRIPVSLKTLRIKDCRKLEFPRKQQHHELLQSLEIENSCDSLTSFPLEIFPNLNSLYIKSCENLESLSVPQSWDAALQSLEIKWCPNFVSFPREGLSAPIMTSLMVYGCDKLKSLPCHMSTLLPKLEHLEIAVCTEIDSFPDGVLPPNLKTLVVKKCEKLLSSLSSIGVHEGLTNLIIENQCDESVKSFPKEGLLRQLPFLTYLRLANFPNMKTLDCNELLHLTSLEELDIEECLKLKNMTGERLPPSLIKLEIRSSDLLEERCMMKHPQIWRKISHIPGVRVDGIWIK